MNLTRVHWLARLGTTLLGALALGWMVWFAGPALRVGDVRPLEAPEQRWIAIAVLLAGIAATWLWHALQARLRDGALIDGISAGEREAKVLDSRFAEALAALRRNSGPRGLLAGRGGQRALYDLPWYVIIGAPGAGKTTALLNAGLEFPLAARFGPGAMRGIGGTRNCDWWFTSEAVLIDTAGRYTTHESDRAADSTAWAAFLTLLARHRPQRPVNGLLIAISTSDLLEASAVERAEHAAKLRARIAEVHATLHTRIPVYVLVTKIDLLAGFIEFFGDLDKDERAQVWGVTFPGTDHATTAGLLGTLPTELSLLGARLDRALLERLHTERDLGRRAALYRFPQHWHVLKDLLPPFLQQVFATTDSSQTLLRGVYFTSGTQEGTPIDRALGGLSRALGLAHRVVAPSRPSGRSYFLSQALRAVIFTEAEIAGTNRRWQRRRSMLQWGVVGATVALVTIAIGALWWQSRNTELELRRWARQVEALESTAAGARAAGAADVAALLPLLQSMSELAATKSSRTWLVGLDQNASLVAAAEASYQSLLRNALLPAIAAGLEQRMRSAPPERIAMLYEALKAYVMLFSGRNFNRDALRAYLLAEWQGALPASVSDEQRRALITHLDRLLASGEVGAPNAADAALLTEVRRRVASTSLATLIYNRLAHIDPAQGAAAFDFARAAGPQATGVLELSTSAGVRPSVAGAYSVAGYQQIVRERAPALAEQFATERAWVMGAGDDVAVPAVSALTQAVQDLYFADHAVAWSTFLSALRMAPLESLSASAQLAGALARPDSPLVALVQAIARELSLGEPAQTRLAPALQALRQFATQRPGPLDDLLNTLGKLAPQLAAFDDASKRNVAGIPPDLGELAAHLPRLPEPVRTLMQQLHGATSTQLAALQREAISQHVRREVSPLCMQTIAGRYPLVRSSREELSRPDFVRMFGGNGVLETTFRRHLATWVDTRTQPWTYRGTDDVRAESTESLRQFQRARAVREAFFRDDGRSLGAALQWRMLELDPAIRQFTMDVDGQTLRFAADTRGAVAMLWPGPDAEAGVRVQVQGNASAPSTFSFSGPWALLRLLDRARVESPDPTRVVAAFDVEGRRARFEIATRGTPNPLRLAVLEQFECPQRR